MRVLDKCGSTAVYSQDQEANVHLTSIPVEMSGHVYGPIHGGMEHYLTGLQHQNTEGETGNVVVCVVH